MEKLTFKGLILHSFLFYFFLLPWLELISLVQLIIPKSVDLRKIALCPLFYSQEKNLNKPKNKPKIINFSPC